MGLIEELKRKLEPTDALIFYSSGSDVYIEHRPISKGVMGAGKPLETSQFANMIRSAEKYAKQQNTMSSLSGAIPPNLLYASTDIDNMRLVWWRKPEKREMFFSEALGIPNGVMQVPGMVYSVTGNTLSVWAFKGRKPKDVLYQAPFFNIHGAGNVCLGNSKAEKPKEHTFENWMLYWEKLFWQSEFESLIIEFSPIDGNLAVLTAKCIREGTPFPTDVLKRANVKMEDLMK